MNWGRLGRFFSGSVAGAVLDLMVGAALVAFGLTLPMACVCGFSAAVLLTYWIHLRWTFVLEDRAIFTLRMLKFSICACCTLGIRLLVLWGGGFFIDQANLILKVGLLGIAVLVTFILNYIGSLLFVFSSGRQR